MITKRQILSRIKAAEKRIAQERDAIRALVEDMEQLQEDCTEAMDDLERAADALSRLL